MGRPCRWYAYGVWQIARRRGCLVSANATWNTRHCGYSLGVFDHEPRPVVEQRDYVWHAAEQHGTTVLTACGDFIPGDGFAFNGAPVTCPACLARMTPANLS